MAREPKWGMSTDGPTPKPCDRKIFRKGKPIVLVQGRSNAVENWVRAVAKKAKAKVDWHYSGGVAQVLYLGNADRARIEKAITALAPTLKGTIMRHLALGESGLYRAL